MSTRITRTRLAAACAVLLSAITLPVAADRVRATGAQDELVTLRFDQQVGHDGPIPIGGSAPMSKGDALVLGQVLEAGSSRPVAGAVVTLTLSGATPMRVLTDGQGRFLFRNLPKGSFSLDAAKPGYLGGAIGRLRPQGPPQPLQVQEDEHVSDVRIVMWQYAAITGTVLDEAGEPVIGATVRVMKKSLVSGLPRLTLGPGDQTDDRGVYRIPMLDPGEYIVCVPMTQQGALSAALEEMGQTGSGGLTSLLSAMPLNVVGSSTNGESTISINVDRQESVSAGWAADGRPLSYPTWFYPSTVSAARAAAIRLASGDERTGVDFQIRPHPTSRIAGVVTSPSGPAAHVTLTLLPSQRSEALAPLEVATARSDAAGAFVFTSVPQGDYLLRVVSGNHPVAGGETFSIHINTAEMTIARPLIMPDPGMVTPQPVLAATGPVLWGEALISADRPDISGLSILLREGPHVSGELDWTGTTVRPSRSALAGIGVTIEPADARTALIAAPVRGGVDADGRFAIAAPAPGRYVLRTSHVPTGWLFQGATAAGRDLVDTPFDLDSAGLDGVTVTFTDRLAALTGKVTNNAGAPDDTAGVLLFPVERDGWTGYGTNARRVRYVRTDRQGAYVLGDLPAGRYHLAALHDMDAGDWQDPAFLEALSPGALVIDIPAGQTITRALRMSR